MSSDSVLAGTYFYLGVFCVQCFLAGFWLSLALIAPIGPQNLFIVNSGLSVGMPRALSATFATTLCDGILISLGVLGAGALVLTIPGARAVLLIAGFIFLTFLGIKSLWTVPDVSVEDSRPTSKLFLQAAAVSLLNPHAILDTVVVIGAAAAAQPSTARLFFALGALSASLIWFILIASAASIIRNKLNLQVFRMVQRISGVILLVFAIFLLCEFVRELC